MIKDLTRRCVASASFFMLAECEKRWIFSENILQMNRVLNIFFVLMVFGFVACNKDEVITTMPVPEIVVENGGVYTTKVGRSVVLAPHVESAEEAVFGWYEKGVRVGDEASYEFVRDVADTYYLTLRVENKSGKDEADFRIEVYDLTPPKIAFMAKNGVLEIAANTATEITPQVVGGEGATFRWALDGEPCGDAPTCTLNLSQTGDYTLSLEVENEDGRAEKSVILRVVEQASCEVVFPMTTGLKSAESGLATYSISLGQSIALAPSVEGFLEPEFRWSVDGIELGNGPIFSFEPTAAGDYEVEVRVSENGHAATAVVCVKCCATEGTFRRAATAESSTRWNKVFEYIPAPGQFIGEDKAGFNGTEQSAEEAAAYAERRLSEGKFLSLGAWGGYVVVGFDHSIGNGEGYDLVIYGNMYKTSSEAGIVWVMQDSNGNGLPDDVWYELRGSEWGKESHSTRYAVTYFRPASEKMPVRWRDNRGGEGEVPYMAAHSTASYFPRWIDADHYTLYGSRLAMNTSSLSSGVVSHDPYAWGYADNLGEDSEGESASDNDAAKCPFDIANAVAADGSAVALQYVDFVRVQSAINGFDSSMGELSTEVLGVEER